MPLPPVNVRAVCDYVVFTEIEGGRFLDKLLMKAVEHADVVQSYQKLAVEPGPHGIQLLVFRVDFLIPARKILHEDDLKEYLEYLLGEIFYDPSGEISVRMMDILS